MAQIGNKLNGILSMEWGKHAQGLRWFSKRKTSKRRRKLGERVVAEQQEIRNLRFY